MTNRPTASTINDQQLDDLYATNQRLNQRAQRLESELAAYRRAVAQWEINERGTYIPHASLRAIGLASGRDILGSVRHLRHFERVEQAEAALAEARRLHAQTCPHAQGAVSTGFTCPLCDALTAPAKETP